MSEKILQAAIIDRLMTQAEVQKVTGLSMATLELWRSKGKGIAWVRVGSRAIRYKESAVIEFISNLTGSTSPMQHNNGAMP